MENKEIKEEKNCCENKMEHSCSEKMSCCQMKKCCMLKFLAFIIIVMIAFCLGSAWTSMKYKRGYYYGGMMNWGANKYNGKLDFEKRAFGDVTVEVTDQISE